MRLRKSISDMSGLISSGSSGRLSSISAGSDNRDGDGDGDAEAGWHWDVEDFTDVDADGAEKILEKLELIRCTRCGRVLLPMDVERSLPLRLGL